VGKVEQRSFVKRVRVRKEALVAVVLFVVLSSFVAACGGGQNAKEFDADGAGKMPEVKTGVKPEPDAEAAVIEMQDPAYGRIVVELYPNLAPKMVERFKTLAREGFYNGTAWHRAEPRANVIQGGDVNSKDDDPSNDGMGDSPYPDLPAEFSDVPYEAGVVGAARTSAPDSANSQFFITLGRVPGWDGSYTVFGRVVEGLGNARVISTAPTRPGTTSPDPKIVVKSITLQPRANFK
jgi:cyclophilin family peptidyl-prolyl cis-trans isomerase